LQKNLIAGFSGLLIRKFKHQSDAEAVLRKINDEALEVNRMVRSLKDLSALDLSETEPSYTEFEIDEIITKLRADSIALSSEKHIQFEIHCSELPGRIVSDKTIFFSILKLAIDTLLFHAPPKSKLVIQSQNSDNWIEFQISDTENPQIPSVAQIFNEHEKAPGTAYVPPGYGTALLNLAVLCAKARLIGAAFEAASTETANSVFTIRFLKNSVSDYSGPDGGVQAAGSEQSEVGSRTRISLSPLMGKTRKIYLSADRVPEILIADTSGNAVTMLSMMLENENYKTSSASSPEEVLGKLKEHHYDMLLLGLNLQRGLCTVLLETIRSKVSDSLVILTLSAELTQAEETSLRESGADRCLVKPVRVEALADAIRDLTVS